MENNNQLKITDTELLRAKIADEVKRELSLLRQVERLKTILEKGRE
jgi:hypothetical protein